MPNKFVRRIRVQVTETVVAARRRALASVTIAAVDRVGTVASLILSAHLWLENHSGVLFGLPNNSIRSGKLIFGIVFRQLEHCRL